MALYPLLVALLSFIKEPGMNIMAIIFVFRNFGTNIMALYSFRVALRSFIKEPGINIMVIIFVPDFLTFIYCRARNKYYGIIFVPGCFDFIY